MVNFSKYICLFLFVALVLSFYPIKNNYTNVYALNETLTETIYVSKDVYIYSKFPDKRYSSTDYLTGGQYPSGHYCRILLFFRTDTIPTDTEIVSAKLVLTLKNLKFFNNNYLKFYVARIKKYWSGSYATWNKRTMTLSWSTPGGDYSYTTPIPSFKVSKTDPSSKRYYIDVTNYVKKWREGTYPNYGIILIPSSSYQGFVWFYSEEYTIKEDRPKVIITYKKPKIEVSSTDTHKNVIQGETVQFYMKVDSQVIDTSNGIEIQIVQNLPSDKGFVINIYPKISYSATYSFTFYIHIIY